MLTEALKGVVASALGGELKSINSIQGGDISRAFRVSSESAEAFLKVHSGDQGAAMFAAEVAGLKTLGEGSILVPTVIDQGEVDGESYLLLEYSEPRNGTDEEWAALGNQLAQLHAKPVKQYGYSSDNFIGSLPQPNDQMTDWIDFFASMRIEPMMQLAGTYLKPEDYASWEKLRAKLPDILVAEQPCLIHGDLWNGNVIHTEKGPMLIDPAVCWAEREMDMAMSRLFGGFPESFYTGYHEQYPLTEEGLQERMRIYQLYYLLVHVVLFGKSYLGSVRGVFEEFN